MNIYNSKDKIGSDYYIYLSLVIIYLAYCAYFFDNHWFGSDAWDYIFRKLESPIDVIKPHGSHLTALQVILFKGIYKFSGMQYAPYSYLHIILSLLVALLFFNYYRKLNGNILIGLCLSSFLLIGVKPNIQAAQFGIYINILMLLVFALIIEKKLRINALNGTIIFFLMLINAISGPIGVFNLIAISLLSVFNRKIDFWLIASCLVFLIYSSCYYLFILNISEQKQILEISFIDRISAFLSIMIGGANMTVRNSIYAPWNIVLALFIYIFYISQYVRNNLNVVQKHSLIVLFFLILSVSLFRYSHDYGRYLYLVLVFLILAFPIIGIKKRPYKLYSILSILLCSLVINANATINEMRSAGKTGELRKDIFEKIMQLIDNGEPSRETRLHPRLSHLDRSMVNKILNDKSYDISKNTNIAHNSFEDDVRANLRTLFWPAGKYSGGPLIVESNAIVRQSCITIQETEVFWASFDQEAVIEIYADPRAVIEFGWVDKYGKGATMIPEQILRARFVPGRVVAHVIQPEGNAEIYLKRISPLTDNNSSLNDNLRICGNFVTME